MSQKDLNVELDEKLALLKQDFLLKLGKMSEQRSKLETSSSGFKVRLEASLGEKLSQARGRADRLEDRLQETRLAFEEKLKKANCMKAELDRRETILVSSIQQVEAYIRAVFYFKKEADDMRGTLQMAAKEQCKTLRHWATEKALLKKKNTTLLKTLLVSQPAKVCLQKMVSGLFFWIISFFGGPYPHTSSSGAMESGNRRRLKFKVVEDTIALFGMNFETILEAKHLFLCFFLIHALWDRLIH